MKISTRFSVKLLTNFSFLFLLTVFASQEVNAQECPTITEEGIFDPNSDVLITSYHQSMAKTTTNYVAWGEDMDASGGDATTITEVIPANGYNYTGTPIHFTVSGNTDGQAFLATTTSLYAWGGSGEVVDGSFVSGAAFNDMNSTQTLPFASANIFNLHASTNVLFVLMNSGEIWVATDDITAPNGNASGNGNIWQQVQTSSGVPLTGAIGITGNQHAGYALLSSGDIYTWGNDVVLGDGTGKQDLDYATLMTAPPVAVSYISSFSSNNAANNTDTGLLALGIDTKIYGVGDNTAGEMITDDTSTVTTWTAIQNSSGTDFIGAIQISTNHTSEEWAGASVITEGATAGSPNVLYTWGLNNSNSLGQGGNGTVDDPTIPPSFNVGTDDPVHASVGGHATTFFNRAGGGSICFVGHIVSGSTGGLTTGTGANFECVIPATVELCASILLIVANDDSGRVIEGIGGIAIANVLANDDYDGSIPTISDVDLTQISTTNPGVTLNTSDGSVNVTTTVPAGTYVVEYQICDAGSTTNCQIAFATVVVLPDNDGDGIPDEDDLDDDNDGITDQDELGDLLDGYQPPCGGDTLDFSGPYTEESGDGNINTFLIDEVFRFPNVKTGVDALITIQGIVNATIAEFDENATDASAFKPQTDFTLTNIGDQAYVEYNIAFVTSGGIAPEVIDEFFVNFNDIDGTADYSEQNWSENASNVILDNPTEITITNLGNWLIGTGGTTSYPDATNANPQVNYATQHLSKDNHTIRVGAVATTAGASASPRLHNIEFSCLTNWVSAQTYLTDFDNDGIPNHLDLDSDNDGCFDALEANGGILASQLNVNGSINNPVNDNGIPVGPGTAGAGTTGQTDVSSQNVSIQGSECQADLSLTKTIDNATPKIGETITYTLTLTNSGPIETTGVQVEDILPAGLLYDVGNSTIPVGTTYDDVTGIWDLSTLTITNGTTYTLQIAAKITPACGEITNTAQIISNNKPDPDSTTNNGN